MTKVLLFAVDSLQFFVKVGLFIFLLLASFGTCVVCTYIGALQITMKCTDF